MLAVELPIAFSSVQAGFPSPADDYLEGRLNIHTHLVKKPASTLFIHAPDDSMIEFGIFQNDLLIVDQSLKPAHNKMVVVDIEGERLVRRFVEKKGRGFLAVGKERPVYNEMDTERGVVIIGVATFVIHNL